MNFVFRHSLHYSSFLHNLYWNIIFEHQESVVFDFMHVTFKHILGIYLIYFDIFDAINVERHYTCTSTSMIIYEFPRGYPSPPLSLSLSLSLSLVRLKFYTSACGQDSPLPHRYFLGFLWSYILTTKYQTSVCSYFNLSNKSR